MTVVAGAIPLVPTMSVARFLRHRSRVLVITSLLAAITTATSTTESSWNQTVEFGDLSVPICEQLHLCSWRTCPPSSGQKGGCRCDTPCTFFGDCCPDYEEEFAMNCQDGSDGGLSKLQAFDRAQFRCTHLKNLAMDTYYWLIASCPETWQDNTIRDQCEAPPAVGVSLYDLPVSSGSISYRNVFCGICNDVHPQNLTQWLFELECPADLVSNSESNTVMTVEQLLQSTRCQHAMVPNAGVASAVRTCVQIDSDASITSCNHSDDEQLRLACSSLTARFQTSNRGVMIVVQNPACFACHYGRFPDQHEVCREVGLEDQISVGILSPVTSLAVLFDFSSQSNVRIIQEESVLMETNVACYSGEVFDPYSQSCVTLYCPDHYEMTKGECVKEMHYDNASICNTLGSERDVAITLADDIDRAGGCAESMQVYRRSNCPIFDWLEELVTYLRMDCSENAMSGHGTVFGWKFRSDSHNLTLFTERLMNVSKEDCNFTSLSMSGDCHFFGNDEKCENSSSNSRSIPSEPKSEDITADDYSVRVLYTTYHWGLTGKRLSATSVVATCHLMTSPLTCPSLRLNESLFTSTGNEGELKYRPTGSIIPPEDYVILEDGTIQVCQFLAQNGTMNMTSTYSFIQYSPGQEYVSLTGTVLSMTSLLVTFVTYSMFPSLRKLISNKLILSLCVTLFLAQGLLTFGGQAHDIGELCTTVAVLCHFFWLMTFMLSSALAYDLNRTFGFHKTIQVSVASRKAFAAYLLVTTSVPLAIVGSSLLLSLLMGEELDLRYGGGGACWIGGQTANLLTFGVPVLVLLVINGLFFARTINGIVQSRKISVTLQEGKERQDDSLQALKIYVKISTLMGFTWLVGFVAAFVGVDALWYVFIVLNSLQGLYIFLAFTATSRVYHLWRDAFAGKTRMSSSGVSSTQSTSIGKGSRSKSAASTVQTVST